MKPYQQGHMDSLCGIYSALNALRLIEKDLGKNMCRILTDDWLSALEERRGKVASVVTNGMHLDDLNFVLNRISEQFPIRKHRPFFRQSNVRLDVFWNRMRRFINEGDNRAVIIAYHSLNFGHWTVVKNVTGKRIYTFDSYGGRWISRAYCTTRRISKIRPIRLAATHAFFLMKMDKNP